MKSCLDSEVICFAFVLREIHVIGSDLSYGNLCLPGTVVTLICLNGEVGFYLQRRVTLG